MARNGRAGVALFITTLAPFVAAIIGILLLTFFAPLLVRVALAFGPAEYFAIILLGLVAAAAITMGSAIKGIGMLAVGILIGTVGTVIIPGTWRFTFNSHFLYRKIHVRGKQGDI